ncbi:hypothetical protein [Candidatus Hodgkinia cicadicola]
MGTTYVRYSFDCVSLGVGLYDDELMGGYCLNYMLYNPKIGSDNWSI